MSVKRRGISEIISTIILILIVSIAGTSLFAYSTNYLQRQNDQFLRNNDLTLGKSQERFTMTTVWWSGSGNFLNITVYNYGQNDIAISDIYIDGVRVSAYSYGRNTQILTERLLQIGLTSPIAIVNGAEYKINIVSSRGVSKIVYWEA